MTLPWVFCSFPTNDSLGLFFTFMLQILGGSLFPFSVQFKHSTPVMYLTFLYNSENYFSRSSWLSCPCRLVFQQFMSPNGRTLTPLASSTTTKVCPSWFNLTSMLQDPPSLSLKRTNWSQNWQNLELNILSQQCHSYPTSTPKRRLSFRVLDWSG